MGFEFYSSGNSNDSVVLQMEELNDSYVIYGQLNNVKQNDISINYDSENSVLTVSAVVSTAINTGGLGVTIQQSNTVTKNFKVENIKATEINGDFDGLNLKITLPKLISSAGSIDGDDLVIDVDYYEME
ncbi:hypothetical protein [Clostridium tarantellae]|uniref:Uncharacterized protein n=1 Tax=Clostridium tarantellae TaxID=39493 RepID=A0A6I1MR66_9CLOT|nr:hypothetical protein [Clostridium tarantellae]MPQ44667.1 hypothetical protein [Clostridium tarantellae]